jgi:Kdo2-lipid IVA lauroyltransferase/acyltransferase
MHFLSRIRLMTDNATNIDPPRRKTTWTRRLRWYFERILGNFVYWLARHISRKSAFKLAKFLGDLFYILFKRYRWVCLDGLEIAFGDSLTQKDREKLAYSSAQTLVRTVMDFLRFSIYSKEELLALAVSVEGKEHLESAINRSKGGVIGISAHLGSWEYSGAWVVASGWQLSAVGKEQRDPGITKIMLDIRSAAGIKHISRSKKGQTEIIRALRTKGTVLGLASDQNASHDGVFVDFFGVPTASVKGPAQLALRYDVPVVPIFSLWDGDYYRIEILPEVPLVRTGNGEQDIITNTQAYQKVIEGMIRKYPGQWLWSHRRWKTRPPGLPPLHKH